MKTLWHKFIQLFKRNPATLSCFDIIQETVEYYRTHPRSTNEYGECQYVGDNGKRCAFSRCMMKPELAKERWDCSGEFQSWKDDHDSVLYPQYRGHPIDFWLEIQQLHDELRYWADTDNEYGGRDLSEIGRERVEILTDKWVYGNNNDD